MKGILQLAALALVLFAIVGGIVAWQIFRWNECREVGHSVFYCIMTAS